MATSTISYSYNESGSWAEITPYTGLYYSSDNGATKKPITDSRLPITSTLMLFYRDETQSYCAFAVFFNGSSTISYTALVVSGMGCTISNGDNASGAITVVTDAVQKSEAGGVPVFITFAQPAPPTGQHVSGLTVNGSTTSPASIAAGGTATIAYQYAADPPAEPVTLTFAQPEEGQNKVNQVRVSVNGGVLSTTSPVEIPAGGTASLEYSYQPINSYAGSIIRQPVSYSYSSHNLTITPVVDGLGFRYYQDSDISPMTKGTQYELSTYKDTEDNLLMVYYTKEGESSFLVMYCAQQQLADSEQMIWVVIGVGVSNYGITLRPMAIHPSEAEYIIGETQNDILIDVNYTNTTVPEVQ